MTHKIPQGWQDQSSLYFAPDEGMAISKSSKSEKYGKGIVAEIRTRCQGKDASLDDKFPKFGANDFYLALRSPRGFGGVATAFREVRDEFGEQHFSSDLDALISIANRAIEAAKPLEKYK